MSTAEIPALFTPLVLRSVSLRNRIVVSPMCMYSSTDGLANDWHLVHLGARATGGAALVITEATAVTAAGRISPADLGIWSDEHVPGLQRITRFITERGAVPGIQLSHAGRKASVAPPWDGGGPLDEEHGGWRPIVAPSAIAFRDGGIVPEALSRAGIEAIVDAFTAAARRSHAAGFRAIELHAAHGYLIHQFLSPLANHRDDEYGGSFANRTRFLIEVVTAVRNVWPGDLPLLVRISGTDWIAGGWDEEQSVALARILIPLGVDLVDRSSGGVAGGAKIPVGPGYQVPIAEAVRRETGMKTGAVGLITEPAQANDIIASGRADVVLLAREMLRDPNWPLRAASELGVDVRWPVQYERAKL